MDSGATDHIVSDASLLVHAKSLNAVLHLPNGTTTPITHIGDLHLTSSLVLIEVLCVPSFNCNLISISKLTADLSATVIFSKSNCLIHDPSLKQMVEIGKVEAGLYTQNAVPTLSQYQCNRVHHEPSLEAQIWHARLGHPAANILNKIPVIPSVSPTVFTTCDICLRAKQQRSSFPSHSSTSYNLFELIHCDLWGP